MIRAHILAVGAAALALCLSTGASLAAERFEQAIAAARDQLGARVGVAVLDRSGAEIFAGDADERFPLNSTFKSFACAALLKQAGEGAPDLQTRVAFETSDLVPYSPVTEAQAGGEGMTLEALCEATLRTSDNTAANLVLDALGGPGAVTAFMRSIGDEDTRLDRREPELNDNEPGDPRDTTTPRAAARSLGRLLLGDGLDERARQTLTGWMEANAVAGPLLRTSLPEGWRIADRSGAGSNGSRSVIAAVWPDDGEAVLVAIYLTGTQADMDARNAAIAAIGSAIFEHLAR